jgi:hypothetical protein
MLGVAAVCTARGTVILSHNPAVTTLLDAALLKHFSRYKLCVDEEEGFVRLVVVIDEEVFVLHGLPLVGSAVGLGGPGAGGALTSSTVALITTVGVELRGMNSVEIANATAVAMTVSEVPVGTPMLMLI